MTGSGSISLTHKNADADQSDSRGYSVDETLYPNSYPGMSSNTDVGKGSRRSSSAAIPISSTSSSSSTSTSSTSSIITASFSPSSPMLRRATSDQQYRQYCQDHDEQYQAELEYQDRSMAMFSRIVAHRQKKQLEQQRDNDTEQKQKHHRLLVAANDGKHYLPLEQDSPMVVHQRPTGAASTTTMSTASALYHYPTKGNDHWAAPTSSFLIPPAGRRPVGDGLHQFHHHQYYKYGSKPPLKQHHHHYGDLQNHHHGPPYAGYVDTALSVANQVAVSSSWSPDNHQRHQPSSSSEDDCVFDLEL